MEKKKIKLNRTKIYGGRYRMDLTYELDFFDYGDILSNKDKLIKIGTILGVEAKTCNDISNVIS